MDLILSVFILIFIILAPTHAYTPYLTTPTSGTIFGTPPYLTVSYYYPITPPSSHSNAYSTGAWPPSLPIRPSGIYECMPPPGAALELRTYTCKNYELPEEQRSPEGILAYEQARAENFDGTAECDKNTGLAMTSLHWGAWQHNCWSESDALREHGLLATSNTAPTWSNSTSSSAQSLSASDLAKHHIAWNSRALHWRRHILLQLAAHNYKLNCKIRGLWLRKNRDLEQFLAPNQLRKMTEKKRSREMQKREARFWQESFSVREVGREMEKWVPIYFERKMTGDEKPLVWLGMGDVEVHAPRSVMI